MDQSKIRVITIDDHHVTRAGLKALLAAEPDIAVVGEGWVGDHLLERVRQHRALRLGRRELPFPGSDHRRDGERDGQRPRGMSGGGHG